MEDIVAEIFKVFLRLVGLAARAMVRLIIEAFFEELAWYVGWPVCRLLTVGYYPAQGIHEQEKASTFSRILVSLAGLLLLIVVSVLIARYAGEIEL